jgi:hypothetical protein
VHNKTFQDCLDKYLETLLTEFFPTEATKKPTCQNGQASGKRFLKKMLDSVFNRFASSAKLNSVPVAITSK